MDDTREEMMEQLSGNEAAAEMGADTQWSDYGNEAAGQEDAEALHPAHMAEETFEDNSPLEGEDAKELLDSLMQGAGQHAQEQAQQNPNSNPNSNTNANAKPVDEADALIKEAGIRSERGQERIRTIVAARKEAEAKAADYEQNFDQFREIMTETRLSPEDFGVLLEYGRLINSGTEGDARVALEMLDAQREELCKRLGIEAPGVDALSDFPELKQAVEDMEITHDRALQLAKFQRQEQAVQQQRQAQYQQQAELQHFQQQLEQVKATAESYFSTRAHEVDYQAKLNRMAEWLKTGDNLMRFVQTYSPSQYLAQLQFMYDNISVPQHGYSPQPLRSRNTMTGRQMSHGVLDNSANIHGHMDALGI